MTTTTNGVSSSTNGAANGHAKPDEKLLITRVVLENFGRFDRYELRPGGHFTLIEGDNEEGKTTIDKAFEVFFGGGNNAKLIRNGSDQASMVVELSDGVSFEKILRRAGKADLKVIHPEYGQIKASQAYLEKMISNYLAVNPAKMIDADAKERVDYLLSRLPIPVPTEQLQSIIPAGITIPDGHALTVLPILRKDLEQRRRAKRTQMEDKQGEVAGLQKSLPPDEDSDISELFAAAKATLEIAKNDKANAISAANATSQHLLNDLTRKTKDFIHAGELELERDIAKLRAEWQSKVDTQLASSQKETAKIEDENLSSVAKLTEQFNPTIEQATLEVGRLESLKEEAVRTGFQRELLTKARQQEQQLTAAWKDLDGRIKALDALGDSLRATLPIEGLAIGEDGDLWVNGVTWEQVNLAKKIDVVFQLAELSSGKLDFVFFDDLEHFSTKNFDLFKERALRSTKQTIANRVADKPLTVSTFEPEVAEVAA